QRVKFLGYIPEDELPDYLVACDVFVHPNWADFAISPYEALALGRKVVWSSEMEVDDDLRRGDNLFVAAPTVEAMAAAIRAELARLGMVVAGSDRSAAMLEQARRNLERAGVQAALYAHPFQTADRIGRTFDVVTAMFSAVNYLTTDGDIASALGAIGRLLA